MLESITSPEHLRRLDPDQLPALADEVRRFLVESVARTGGHLGPNLGVVELTIALHRVFESPRDALIWDTGHQAYVHKLLTGRRGLFPTLRREDGLSGYPRPAESEHDLVENSHASTALSYADGLAKARALTGRDNSIVAIVGDGAMTGGLSWEALNNLAAAPERPVVIVLNDNGRSYAPTVGGLARHLAALRARRDYGQVVRRVRGGPVPSARVPDTLFDELGLHYLGPVDGHDIAALEAAFRTARDLRRPVVVHCVTTKGRGYAPAEAEVAEHMHTVGQLEAATGVSSIPPRQTWTDVFADELTAIGAARPDVVALTAAMPGPTGLAAFAAAYPERCFDVGIAEQHAVVSAAGLALGGLHPVVAVYATFLNRAFDQVLMDAALHRLPLTLVLDRAGITGPDGPSHHGVWDLAVLQIVPGIRIAAPRDAATLRAELREAVAETNGPTVVRFPKAAVGPDIAAQRRLDRIDILREAAHAEVLLVSVGALAQSCLEAAELLEQDGVETTVVDPRWVVPVDSAIPLLAARHDLVVTVEDGSQVAGIGTTIAQALSRHGVDTPIRVLGVPRHFVPQGDRTSLLSADGLGAAGIAAEALDALADLRGAEPRLLLVETGGAL